MLLSYGYPVAPNAVHLAAFSRRPSLAEEVSLSRDPPDRSSDRHSVSRCGRFWRFARRIVLADRRVLPQTNHNHSTP